MSTYHVVRMDKPDWSAVEAVELHHQPWLKDNGVRAHAQACHDGERIHVRMEAKEAEIRATLTQPLDAVCTDSCLEFFFAPEAGDDRYFNLEWNPLGTLYLGFGAARETRVRMLVKDKDALFAPKPYTVEGGWGIEFSVPVAFIRLFFPRFFLEGEAAGNFYKCGDKTSVPHYLAWAPLTSARPDYHRRGDFGKLIFD